MIGSIFHEGKEYISAIQAAKKIGYASDYVGQLCRSKKIPARLIGKTWYVDYGALSDHRKNRKLGKRGKTQISIKIKENKIIYAPVPVSTFDKYPSEIKEHKLANKHVITYEKDDRPRLPELSKKGLVYPLDPKIPEKVSIKIIRPNRFWHNAAPVALSLMLIFGLVGLSLGNLSYSKISKFEINISNVVDPSYNPAFVSSAISWISNFFRRDKSDRDKVRLTYDDSIPSTSSGLVVIPQSKVREGTIDRIKRAFSDEVDVTFDESGTAGVITPVFREADDFENYAFVLVPLNNPGQPNTEIQ